MSDADWIEKLSHEIYEQQRIAREYIEDLIRQAHAAHFATGDTDKLAERIAKAVILESVRYLHRDMEDHHQECEVRDWYEAKSATYQGVIYAMLAPILAHNAALEAVLLVCGAALSGRGYLALQDRIRELTAKGAGQ